MAQHNPMSESQIHLQLTAYLDGELDDAETRAVEQRLIEDSEFRARMQALQKSWDLLDMLPTSQTANSFTKSTMELVIADATKNLAGGRRRFWAWPLRLGSVLAVALITFACSYGLMRFVQDSPSRDLYDHLPVIENLDQLQLAESVEYLSALVEEGLFDDDDESSTVVRFVGQTSSNGFRNSGSIKNRDDARRYIRKLPPHQLAMLKSNRDSFDRLSTEQQFRLADLYHQLYIEPRRDELLKVLQRYSRWLDTLGEAQRARLLDMSTDRRIAQIPVIKRQQLIESFGKAGATRMPEQDAQAVYQWVVAMLERQAEKIQWKFLRMLERNEISQATVLPLLVTENDNQTGNRNAPNGTARKRAADLDVMHFGQMLLAIGESKPNELGFIITSGSVRSEIEILKSVVSQKAVSIIESQDAEEQIQLAFSWVEVALMSVFRAPEERLQQFFDELNDLQKTELDQLPPDQRKLQLKKKYLDWSKTRRSRESD